MLPVLPAVSTYWYVRTYVPVAEVFTDPDVGRRSTPDPSTLSVHVAPDSE